MAETADAAQKSLRSEIEAIDEALFADLAARGHVYSTSSPLLAADDGFD